MSSAPLGPGSQPSVRPSVRSAVRCLPRAAGERAKLAHLSSAGAASTFKSRSSFSFTFCLLPGRAYVTWGRTPPPIGCAGRRRSENGAPPLPPGLAGSGLRAPPAERAGPRAGACAPGPRRANLKGAVASKAPRLEPRGPAASSRPRPRAASGARTYRGSAEGVLFLPPSAGTNLPAAHPSVGCCCCARDPEEVPGVGSKVLPLHIRPQGAGREPEGPSHRREPAGSLSAPPALPGGARRLLVPPSRAGPSCERSLLIFHDILNHRTYLHTLPARTKITATIIMIIKRVLYLLHPRGGRGSCCASRLYNVRLS